jgi:hypothetical protein
MPRSTGIAEFWAERREAEIREEEREKAAQLALSFRQWWPELATTVADAIRKAGRKSKPRRRPSKMAWTPRR